VAVVAGKPSLLARVALLAVAVIACAWFALGAVQILAQNRAAALIPASTDVSPQVAHAIANELDRAGTLNPDRSVDLLRAQLYLHSGRRPAAERLIQRVGRDEPNNINVWFLLQIVAFPRDPATVQMAHRRALELDPPVPAAP
jgi:predicted Zn-dependent protease